MDHNDPDELSVVVIWNRISKRYSRLRALQLGGHEIPMLLLGSAWILLSLIAMVLPEVLPIANHALAAGRNLSNRIELSVLMMTLVLLGIPGLVQQQHICCPGHFYLTVT